MKKINRITLVFLCALGLLFANACTKDFLEMNTDPKIITSELIDVGLLLTNVETTIPGSASYGNGTYGSYCGMCNRGDDAKFKDTDAPGIWDGTYAGTLNNLSNIIQLIDGKADKADLVNKQAIARILRVWVVSKLTDTYGDVPYSESCLPKENIVLQPKYDTQQSIYVDMFKELKEAAAQLDDAKASYGAADLVYGGSPAKWRKLANSLRLRLALRVRYVDAALATAQLSDLTEAGLINVLAEDAFVKNTSTFTNQLNPRYYRIINYNTISEEVHTNMCMIDILRNDSINLDPRIQIYADTVMAAFKGGLSPNGYFFPAYDYRGAPTNGLVNQIYKYPWGSETVSKIADFWRVPIVAPAIMKCSEVYFALAEAKLAGLLPAGFSGTANSYYQKGIDEAILWAKWFYDLTAPQIGPLMKTYLHNAAYAGGTTWTDADVTNYLDYKRIKDATIATFKATPIYTLSGTNDNQLEMIMNQKIVALYPDEFQGWCEYRRTGYPKVPIGPDTDVLAGVVPRREPWPTSEETRNSVQFNVALELYGTDSRLTKFWWDANPDAPHIYVWTPPSQTLPYQ